MNSVLLQEAPAVQDVLEESSSIPVNVAVLDDGTFVPYAAKEFQVETDALILVGSGGLPREFVVTFTLSREGYYFANPALKFFQGGSRDSGFRVSPNPDRISATVTLFNTKKSEDPSGSDEFSLLIVHPSGRTIPHDPTIVWNPPNG